MRVSRARLERAAVHGLGRLGHERLELTEQRARAVAVVGERGREGAAAQAVDEALDVGLEKTTRS